MISHYKYIILCDFGIITGIIVGSIEIEPSDDCYL